MGLFDRLRGKPEPLRLREGTRVDVVGESHYQDNLRTICGGKTPDRRRLACTATLVPEPDNPYDRHAIAVHINGRKVGHLSRDNARAYGVLVQRLAGERRVGQCSAAIVGGWDDGRGDEGHFGVQLDIAPPGWAHPADLPPPTRTSPVPPSHSPGIYTGTSTTSHSAAGAVAAGAVDGRHYTEWVDTVKSLKREGRHPEALALLYRLCSAAEAESTADRMGLAPWYFEQAAIVERKLGNLDGEIAVLERYARSPWAKPGQFDERLAKARARARRA